MNTIYRDIYIRGYTMGKDNKDKKGSNSKDKKGASTKKDASKGKDSKGKKKK